MGFNKRFVSLNDSLSALKNGNLRSYYGKSDILIFEDNLSSQIFSLFQEGKTEQEILLTINKNMEETSNEVY